MILCYGGLNGLRQSPTVGPSLLLPREFPGCAGEGMRPSSAGPELEDGAEILSGDTPQGTWSKQTPQGRVWGREGPPQVCVSEEMPESREKPPQREQGHSIQGWLAVLVLPARGNLMTRGHVAGYPARFYFHSQGKNEPYLTQCSGPT